MGEGIADFISAEYAFFLDVLQKRTVTTFCMHIRLLPIFLVCARGVLLMRRNLKDDRYRGMGNLIVFLVVGISGR